MSQRTNTQVMGATLLGGLLGAGLAMLFAPKSGRETRRQIHEGVNQAKEEANAKLNKVKSLVRKQLDTPKQHKINEESPILSAWEEEV